MTRTLTHCCSPRTVAASPAIHMGALHELTPCSWRRFSPFGTRISVRPGLRARVLHRVVRRRRGRARGRTR